MRKTFCDRCKKEITAFHKVEASTEIDNRECKINKEYCQDCYRLVWKDVYDLLTGDTK